MVREIYIYGIKSSAFIFLTPKKVPDFYITLCKTSQALLMFCVSLSIFPETSE